MAPTENLSPVEMQFLENYFLEEYPNMLRIAQATLANRQQAEEAVQETFLLAIQKFAQFRNSPNPTGWLYRALRYQIGHMDRDWQKAVRRTVAVQEPDELLAYELEDAALPSDPAIQESMELLIRFYIDGYTAKELAQEAGCSTGAMKMRIIQAKQELRKFWREYED